ncbi:MAG: hypothetical protein AMXMBFR13_29920 [Phycisphaerae bacterium]
MCCLQSQTVCHGSVSVPGAAGATGGIQSLLTRLREKLRRGEHSNGTRAKDAREEVLSAEGVFAGD